MSTATDDSLRTRATLLSRIRNLADGESWAEFYRLYQNFVLGVARKRGLRQEDAEDVAQEVFWRVAQKIQDFEVRSRTGSFRRWLSQLVRWRATDKLRQSDRLVFESMQPVPDDDHPAPEPAATVDVSEEVFAREAQRYLLTQAFERMERQLAPKQIQVFQLLVLQNEPVERVCAVLGMTRSAVYVAKHRVAARLRVEIERLRGELA